MRIIEFDSHINYKRKIETKSRAKSDKKNIYLKQFNLKLIYGVFFFFFKLTKQKGMKKKIDETGVTCP